MKTLFLLAAALLCGCVYRPPEAVINALSVQAKYTSLYVARTLDSVEDEETRLIGIEIVRNADALHRWARAGDETDEKKDNGRD